MRKPAGRKVDLQPTCDSLHTRTSELLVSRRPQPALPLRTPALDAIEPRRPARLERLASVPHIEPGRAQRPCRRPAAAAVARPHVLVHRDVGDEAGALEALQELAEVGEVRGVVLPRAGVLDCVPREDDADWCQLCRRGS